MPRPVAVERRKRVLCSFPRHDAYRDGVVLAVGEQVHGSGPRAAVQFGQGQLEEFAALLDQCAVLQFALQALGNVGDQRVARPLAEGLEFAGAWSLGAATPALQPQELGLEALQQGVVAAMALEAQAAALLE